MIARLCLLAAGALELHSGVSHFFMPDHVALSPGYARLQPHEMDWNTLCVFAIGILLIAMGLLSVLFALYLNEAGRMSQLYCLISTVLFGARIVIELKYPVSIRLFGEQPPSVLPGLGVVLCLFAVASLALWRRRGIPSAQHGPDPSFS